MSTYLKPQSPLYHKTEDAYFYPLTTADQVIMPNGTRLDDNVGGTKMELLWENAKPTSDFAAQTVNIELNDYAYIGIDYIMNTSNQYRMWTQCEIGSIGAISLVHLKSADPTVFVDRCFVVNDSNIEFYNAYIATGTNSAVASYSYAIPIKIYGIK